LSSNASIVSNASNIQLPDHVRAAALELLERSEIRRSLKKWAIKIGYIPAYHHQVMIAHLEKVAWGKIKRLLIMMPPGSAKSSYGSVAFVTWYLNQPSLYADVPVNSILACSYSKDLVVGFGRDCRNHVENYGNVLGYTLAPDSKAADEWQVVRPDGLRGRYFCAGTGAGIAGHRATLGLIDDPVGDETKARSKIERTTLIRWYINDFYPRLLPDAPIVLICNRRDEEDLAGYLLQTEPSEWTVLDFPLLARENDVLGRPPIDFTLLDRLENGTIPASEIDSVYEDKIKPSLLWNTWFNKSTIKGAIKDARTFATLWQQRPTPESGDFFKKEDICEYTPDQLPKDGLRIYIASDHAVSEAETANRTCLLPVGVDDSDNIWILPDIFWKVSAPGDVVEAMLDMAARRQPSVWWAEKGHISMALKPLIEKRQRERGPYFYIEEVHPGRDKRTRASAIKGRMQAHKVFFPAFCHWWPDALHELMSFTGSGSDKSDDFVDALAHIGMGLNRMTSGRRTVNQEELNAQCEREQIETLSPSRLTMKWIKDSANRLERYRSHVSLDK
jgi:predicted phage terminase large subunit-like protein